MLLNVLNFAAFNVILRNLTFGFFIIYLLAIPEDAVREESDEEEKANPDERLPQASLDKRIVPDNEFSDSEDEGEGGRRDQRSFKGRKRPRLDTKAQGEGSEEKAKPEGEAVKPEAKSKFCTWL